MDCNLPGSSIHGILQARILESVAISFSTGSFPPRDQAVPYVSCIANRFFPAEPLGKPASPSPPQTPPPADSRLWHLRGAWLGCRAVVRVHGSSPSFAGTQVLFTTHLPTSPGGRQGSAGIPPPSGRQRRVVRKDSHVPKDLSSPPAEPGPRSRLRASYSLSVAASGGKGLGGPWDFRTPHQGLDPLEIQPPPNTPVL